MKREVYHPLHLGNNYPAAPKAARNDIKHKEEGGTKLKVGVKTGIVKFAKGDACKKRGTKKDFQPT